MNSNCSVIVISDSNTSNVVEYVEKDGQTVILQDSNLIPSTPIFYYNKTQINSYTGQTLTNINSRLLTTIFNNYTGATIPNSYYNKTQINSYTGITVPNIYQTIANVNHYTGTTAPNSFLGINACANDSNKLGTHLSNYFLNTGSTITLTTCSTTAENALCLNGHTENNLSVNNSVCLNGHPQGYYLLSGGTAVCATSAINSKSLCGCIPSCFLGVTATASDSSKLNNKLPTYYLNTGSTITCAADSAKLNNKLPTYYLNTGSTAICATSSIDSKALCGCIPSCF